MNPHQHHLCSSELKQILQQQTNLVSVYIDYLNAIKNAIGANDNSLLNQLLEENPIDITSIENFHRQQELTLQQHGFKVSNEGLQECLKMLKDPSLLTMKEELDNQLTQLEKSLLINDLLIRKNQQRIRQSIQILSGRTLSNDNTATYSREGNTDKSDKNKRSLALA